jgi:hypothetical protein
MNIAARPLSASFGAGIPGGALTVSPPAPRPFPIPMAVGTAKVPRPGQTARHRTAGRAPSSCRIPAIPNGAARHV